MPKSNLLPFLKSTERLTDVRLKDDENAQFKFKQSQIEEALVAKGPLLKKEQLDSIIDRKNPVNGRYVAAYNVKKAIIDMYPLITKPQEQINPSPITPLAAPKVAPPPIIEEAVPKTNVQEAAKPNVVSVEKYRNNTLAPTAPAEAPASSQNPGVQDETQEQAARAQKAREDLLAIFEKGKAA